MQKHNYNDSRLSQADAKAINKHLQEKKQKAKGKTNPSNKNKLIM